MVEQVSDLTKLNWKECYQLNIGEFFNYATLAKMKIEEHNKQQKKLMSKYRK